MSRDAIESLVHRYSDAVVNENEEQWTTTWAADAVWDIGRGRRVEGRDAIVDLWRTAMHGLDAVIQTVLNGDAELDDEAGTGTGRWYILEATRRGAGENSMLIGHYDDEYVRTDGEWRFRSRVLTSHYRGEPDLSGEFRAASGD